jgi:hypothetical protein
MPLLAPAVRQSVLRRIVNDVRAYLEGGESPTRASVTGPRMWYEGELAAEITARIRARIVYTSTIICCAARICNAAPLVFLIV